jgi:2-polyprenyl-6-methoxyphenol hydroxylase-like FAD-dependent oxidoreductase
VREQKVIIIGGGIGGLTTAAALRQVSIAAEVWEQAPELRAAGTGLTVASNAVTALQLLDIDLGFDTLRGAFVQKFQVLTPRGRVLIEPPTVKLAERVGAPSVCIHRGDLQAALLEAAGDTPVHLGAVATGFNYDDHGVRVRFADGREARGSVLVGADGIRSVVRSQLHGEHPTRYGGFVCWLAATPLSHPRITPGWNAQYWGRGRRFGIHDIGQGRVYWWGTRNMPEHQARTWKGSIDEIARTFAGWAPETAKAIEVTPRESIVAVPSQDRPFVDHWGEGPVTLLGDAAHCMLTSLAQGGSSAIEDAVVLAKTLRSTADPVSGLRAYEDLRRERTRKLVEVSYQLHRLEQQENPLLLLARTIGMRFRGKDKMMEILEDAMTMPPLPENPTKGALTIGKRR